MNGARTRRTLGGYVAQTARTRMLDSVRAAATAPNLTTTRARLLHVVESMQPVDPTMAEALGQLLADCRDAPHPALLPRSART